MRKLRCHVSRRVLAVVTTLTVVLWVVFLAPGPAAGQGFWSKDTPKVPMAPTWVAQKAKLPPYSPPRTPDGVPDLQGVWGGAGGDGAADLEDHEFLDATSPGQETYVVDPPDGKIPYTPWALAKRDEIKKGLGRGWPGQSGPRTHGSPRSLCLNSMPRIIIDGGQEIVQKPGYLMILTDSEHRVIPTDGRPPISQNAKFWFGNSRGHWEGDTLVVEVTSLNGRGWLDTAGNYGTENTRLVERWRLADADTIDYEVTVEDPTIYTRPWKMTYSKRRSGTGPRGPNYGVPGATSGLPSVKDPYAGEFWEEACFEGNHENTISQHELGFKWFKGVTPPK